jgi:fructokinase
MAHITAAMEHSEPLIAGVELGGTKSIALIARGRRILRRFRTPTGDPAITLANLAAHLSKWQEALGKVDALGIASFGPLALDPDRPGFGRIGRTTKAGWSGVDVKKPFCGHGSVPMGFDTDVGGAALAESYWGAARDHPVAVYLTIGTGIGAGVVVHGRPVHGRLHPELGHIRVRRASGDLFGGLCPFHGDCLEGLASGPAITARAGAPAESLTPDNPLWSIIAEEVAALMTTLILTLSPGRILIGGGVGMSRAFPLDEIRRQTRTALGGYLPDLNASTLRKTIRRPALGANAGPLGAIALGLAALKQQP